MRGTIIFGINSEDNRARAISIIEEELGESRHIRVNTHPDFLLVQPENGQIAIEEARRINEFAQMKPAISKAKTILIDSIETMSPNSANAILKTLEEINNVLFLLTTTKLSSILPTIKSRCIKIRVNGDFPIKNNDFAALVNNYLTQNIAVDYELAKNCADNYEDFIKLCLHYCYTKLKENHKFGLKISKLQTLLNLSNNTYPNGNYVVLLAMKIMAQ